MKLHPRYRLNVRAIRSISMLWALWWANEANRGNFFQILKRLLKTYSPESFTLVHSANIPDVVILGDGDHPKSIGQDGKKAISALLSGRIRRLSIDEQIINWLQRLELIDSYDLQPISDTRPGIMNSSSKSTKAVPKSDSQISVSVFLKSYLS